jgi:hypothetical protein
MPQVSPRLASSRIFSGPGRQFRGTSFGDRERRAAVYPIPKIKQAVTHPLKGGKILIDIAGTFNCA